MSSCGFVGLPVANPLQPTPKSVANPLQRGSLEITPEFCSALGPIRDNLCGRDERCNARPGL
jgi:hypothetical protein